ncbi:MAG: carbohydrate binding family 9 domain-containing protein [Pyrinomonadaceae bacterium MAG19_C2-C3]|nr:carbohydrate binding family 9 domain-containing protein [Pyrinomonadaceae bacterium MAG19_C2-C3]
MKNSVYKFVCLVLLCIVVMCVSVSAQTVPETVVPARNDTPTIAPSPEISNPSTANDSPSPTVNQTNAAEVSTVPNTESINTIAAFGAPLVDRTVRAKTVVNMVRFESVPVIDGRLDDAVWRGAARLDNFYQTQPGDNVRPSKATEAYFGYDAKHFYIAIHAFDEPSQIRASIAKRDEIFGEDNIRIYLDTFNDRRRAYLIGFNPLGIQADGIYTEGGRIDFSFDVVMESKGIITEDGYTIEVAIPFKSLRYEAGKGKQWGFHVWRNIARLNDEIDSFMPISRDIAGVLNQAGKLTGLEGIDTERTIEIIPSLTLSETGRRVGVFALVGEPPQPARVGSRFTNGSLEFEPGLTAKFGLTPTVTLDFALNPDFAQVEADATVVTANQRFPIFFPEKRLFFLEGIDIFQTRMNILNTRAIVDPDYAAKLTGKRGRNSFGFILASDNAPGNFSDEDRIDPDRRSSYTRFLDPTATILDRNALIGVLRVKRDIGAKDSSLGFFATTYNFIERHNHLAGFDGRFRLTPQTFAEFQITGTTSRRVFFDPDNLFPDPRFPAGSNRTTQNIYRTGNGLGYSYALDKTGRNFGYTLNGVGRTRDYRADVGFTPRTNTNQHRLAVRFSDDPDAKRRIIGKRLTSSFITSHDFQGHSQNHQNVTELTLTLQRNTYIGGGTEAGFERLFEFEFGRARNPSRTRELTGSPNANPNGAFFGAPERSAYYFSPFVFIESAPIQKLRGSLVVAPTWGAFDFDFGGGDRFPRVSPPALVYQAELAAYEILIANLKPDERPPPPVSPPLDPGTGRALFVEAGIRYLPVSAFNVSLNYTKSRLTRDDTNRVAFDDNIFVLRSAYQFTRFIVARGRVDYSTLTANVRAQFLLGYTPSPGTAFFAGYNDDVNRNGFSRFSGQLEPGFRRNGRTFFIKASYLFRKSI